MFLLRSCHREFNQDFLNGELQIAEKETRKCGGQKDFLRFMTNRGFWIICSLEFDDDDDGGEGWPLKQSLQGP